MKQFPISMLLVILTAGPAWAHFIWIVPAQDGTTVRVMFSEIPEPDQPKFLDRIAQAKLYLRRADGTETMLKWTKGKEAYQVTVPRKGPRTLGAICSNGVLLKEDDVPFLVMNYAKAFLPEPGQPGGQPLPSEAWDRLPLEIVQADNKHLRRFRVLWQGKPLGGAEVVFLPPGKDILEKRKTDQTGVFDVGHFGAGTYGFRVRHIEVKDGQHDGRMFKEIRHYSTLVVELPNARPDFRSLQDFGSLERMVK